MAPKKASGKAAPKKTKGESPTVGARETSQVPQFSDLTNTRGSSTRRSDSVTSAGSRAPEWDKDSNTNCAQLGYTVVGLGVIGAALYFTSTASASPSSGSVEGSHKNACDCFDPAAGGKLLKELAVRKQIGAGKIHGYVAENTPKEVFNARIAEAKAASSQCVDFYSIPHTISGPQELRKFLTENQAGSKQCHVWTLDDVVEGGWSEDTWNSLKELFNSRTLGNEKVLSDSDAVGMLLIRSDGIKSSLHKIGMPPRVGFAMGEFPLS